LYLPHDDDAGAPHAPLPSQVDSGLSDSPSHSAVLHTTAGPALKPAHVVRFVPSHAAAEQTSVPALHAGRAPCGVPVTGPHVPSPLPSQASH
jgi:hypothetical protein